MQRWEYTHIEGPERRLADLVAQMNEGGEKGWEAFGTLALKKGITADTVAVLFKRPKSDT